MTTKHPNRYGCSPHKGTKRRSLLLLLLRPQGATYKELEEVTGYGFGTVNNEIGTLKDQKGWDIRAFPLKKGFRKGRKGRLVYKVVGKLKWNGGYRTLVDPATYVPTSPSKTR